ncbi:hypothetical protein [Shouchella clausii]|uniref:hypothetical protein n=1 Tax=Shouchella clausii TaxID=79880 RepID=UPI000BA58F8A|nr:hypothetical protein [Shouchella clausii]PAD46643.1 hypothetical protein CHI09_10985 [Shouchella clausii]
MLQVATNDMIQNVIEELALLKAKQNALIEVLVHNDVIRRTDIEVYEELISKQVDEIAAEIMQVPIHQYKKHKAEMKDRASI